MTHRKLKKDVFNLLNTAHWPEGLERLRRLPPRQAVNPLFGLLYHGEPLIRWRAVTAMGAVVADLADRQMESARIIMRRFMWNLNDESGGMGWGSPEAMGETMARHPGLAREYSPILISYADPQGNFLEHPGLQHGVLWALGRLGRVRPERLRRAAAFVRPYLKAADPNLLGMALWALIALADSKMHPMLRPLLEDNRSVTIYIDDELATRRIGDLAQTILEGRFP